MLKVFKVNIDNFDNFANGGFSINYSVGHSYNFQLFVILIILLLRIFFFSINDPYSFHENNISFTYCNRIVVVVTTVMIYV